MEWNALSGSQSTTTTTTTTSMNTCFLGSFSVPHSLACVWPAAALGSKIGSEDQVQIGSNIQFVRMLWMWLRPWETVSPERSFSEHVCRAACLILLLFRILQHSYWVSACLPACMPSITRYNGSCVTHQQWSRPFCQLFFSLHPSTHSFILYWICGWWWSVKLNTPLLEERQTNENMYIRAVVT